MRSELGGAPTQSLSLKRAVEMALQNNLDARVEKSGIKVAQARVRFAAGAFDPVFQINVQEQSLRRLENINDVRSSDVLLQQRSIQAQEDLTNAIRLQQGLPPLSRQLATSGLSTTVFDVQTFQNSAALVGRASPFGTRYSFQIEANRLRNTFSGDQREIVPEYEAFVGVTVAQPLLRGFGPGVNLAELRIARINKEVQRLEWRQKLSAAVQGVMSTYYDMQFGAADVQVRRDAVAADQKLVQQNERRMELGFMQPFDVQQARAQVSLDEEQLLSSRNLFMERQFALKRLILGEFDVNDARVFLPEDTPPLKLPRIDRSALLAQAFANRPDFQQVLADADAQDIRLRFARNQLLPQLDLVATYGVNGLADDYSGSFNQAFRGRTPTWAIGLNLQVPLANVQARARLAEARGQKEQAILRIAQTELTIGVDVDTVISRIETNRQRVETARKTRELNEQAMAIASRRLEEGQISSFDIIEQQRKFYDARSRELAAGADLNKAITQLWLVTGTVLQRAGIEVRE